MSSFYIVTFSSKGNTILSKKVSAISEAEAKEKVLDKLPLPDLLATQNTTISVLKEKN